MKQSTLFAVVLIVLGVAAFAYQGITYKTREKAFNIGSVHVTTEKTKNIQIPPIVGVIALIGGITLLIRNNQEG